MAVGVTVTDEATPTLEEIQRSMPEVVHSGALMAGERVRTVIAKEVIGTYSAGKIRSGSRGGLARSFAPSVLRSASGSMAVGVFSDLSYAGIQNRGGTIRPRTGKNLAIPLRDQEKNSNIWPRNHTRKDELQLIISKRGNKLLAFVNGDNIEPVYLLKPQVTIRGTHYLERSREKSVPIVEQVFGERVSIAVTDAASGARK